MNMKSVEMQIAVPRTSEAGRVQHDQQHRPILDQSLLSVQALKDSEIERRRSAGVDESAHNTTVRREGNGSFAREQEHGRSGDNPDEQAQEHRAEHPYKGRHIDLSL
ncbi:hypothetical protein MJ257_10520 [Paenibacillus timonensis]|jgi:hypothetical protein|uniref:Uncharacterized protein n=1 Tax=Paenibacillus timonensis TaxID=225915 RepID=A0ABW3SCV4_9BACL|nr:MULTISPECIES: hypothetical protein [Paenibacillus]MCH1640542.1 hypothetical protein [Paenibacillus timonensis]MDU2241988.1 hypothetical protein [Paenibacillus sp.]GJM83590.1 hypothetical protein HMSSN139_60860 [Paenibacillus sp. HMSSN-139]